MNVGERGQVSSSDKTFNVSAVVNIICEEPAAMS